MYNNLFNCGMEAPSANDTQTYTEVGKKYVANVSTTIANAIEKEMNRGKLLPMQVSLFDKFWTEASQYDYSNICPEIDITKDYGEDEFLLEIGGVPTMPRGDIQAIKAHAKEGKTMLTSIFVSALLGSEKSTELDVRGREENLSILYFDTEQHQRNTKRIMLRINAMRGVAKDTVIDGLKTYSIRELNQQHRIYFILNKIKTYRPDVVIIDGIRDLVRSINDEAECNEMIQLLANIAVNENIAILCVLHKNKNRLDDTMRGHLGAELENKASSVWEVSRNGNIVTVDETHARNEPTEKWQFKIGAGGIPCTPSAEEVAGTTKKKKKDKIKLQDLNIEEVKTFLKKVATEPISYSTTLAKAIHKEYDRGMPNARELAQEMIQSKLLLPINQKYIYYEFANK